LPEEIIYTQIEIAIERIDNGKKQVTQDNSNQKLKCLLMKSDMVKPIIVFGIIVIIVGFVFFTMYKSNKKIRNYQFSAEELEIVETFKEINIQPDIDNPYTIVKWKEPISIFVENLESADYVPDYVPAVIENLNTLIQKSGVSIKLTNNRSDSNVILYIGKQFEVEKLEPGLMNDAHDYDELFGRVEFIVDNGNSTIYKAKIYIDSERTYGVQFTTLLEEMMHCIGFGGHTKNSKSILYEDRTKMNFTKYNSFDESMIRLLYNPFMYTGLNGKGVEKAAKKIFMENKK